MNFKRPVALLSAEVFAVAGCATDNVDTEQHALTSAATVALAQSPLEWEDGFDHVVVFAEPDFGIDNANVADPASNDRDASRIERADGSVELADVEPGSLNAVTPTEGELEFLRDTTNSDAKFASIVEDVTGSRGQWWWCSSRAERCVPHGCPRLRVVW